MTMDSLGHMDPTDHESLASRNQFPSSRIVPRSPVPDNVLHHLLHKNDGHNYPDGFVDHGR